MTDFEAQVFELEAIAEIQRLMGAYSFLLDGRKYDEVVGLFSKKQPDVRVEMTNGVYQGYDSIVRLYPGMHYWQHTAGHYLGYQGRGGVAKHSQNTPLVVIGSDQRTAKGTWISLGFAAGWNGPVDGECMFNWGMFRYGADFIYEDGEWKIWHLHVFSGFMATYDSAWSEPRKTMPMPDGTSKTEQPRDPNSRFPKEYHPDFPSTTTFDYRPELIVPNLPGVPEPYELFDFREAY